MDADDYYGDPGYPGPEQNRLRGRQAPYGSRQNRGNGRVQGVALDHPSVRGRPRGQRDRGRQPRGVAPQRRAQGHGQVFQFHQDVRPLEGYRLGDNDNRQPQNANLGQNQNLENQHADVRRNVRNYNNDPNHIQPDDERSNQRNRQNLGRRNQNANMERDGQMNNDAPNRNDNRSKRNHWIGFTGLQELAQSDNNEIFIKINQRKDGFINLLDSTIDKDKADLFALIMKIISKVCQSPFDSLKHSLLLKICGLKLIGSLRIYLMDLPYADDHAKTRNRLYWQNQQEFWQNIVIFCKCIIDISPGTALEHCRSLIESTSEACLKGLSERHGFALSAESSAKIAELRERLVLCERNKNETQQEGKRDALVTEAGEPPEDFRELSVVPGRDDMLGITQPFLRANVVSGAYRDVEHYLDVQFRLLREDCFGPLREGILQYIEDPARKKKFDHIRVFNDVKFVEPYISQSKIGFTVEFDDKTKKRFKRINWAHSKRFIFGSLLLFTKDNCRNFITATILDRDVKMLNQGKIAVSMVDSINGNVYNDDSYVMIESEVYFEPYFHVLKAMQDPRFPENLAMSKYIVHVDPVPREPAYLGPNVAYKIEETEDFEEKKFRVLDDQTWPTKEELGLNGSQYEAYKLALTHEFAVIQGPPGTGKTFLGVKVAKTLIENLSSESQGCLLFVICYTNHALDQFLEAILPVTRSIVRFGGQSRNEAMQNLNINKLRRSRSTPLFNEQRYNLKRAVLQLKHAQERLDALNDGVISYTSVKQSAPECEALGEYYSNHRRGVKSDPLIHWLFEHMDLVDFGPILTEETEEPNNEPNNVDEIIDDRGALILDDLEDNEIEDVDFFDCRIRTSFTVKGSKNELNTLRMKYNLVEDRQTKRKLQQEIVNFKSRILFFEAMSLYRNSESDIRLHGGMDLAQVPVPARWALYFRWANLVANQIKAHIKSLQAKLELVNTAYEESRMILDLHILKKIKVVGMTTSGAARLRKLLQGLAPPIVIVEEAAEVLEQHIVTSLTKDCEHLILIGDHQQLRPSAAYMKLARKYNLEVSLFERMITNGMHSRRLGVQHRMRPELAALISPHIYEHLENHPSVEHFPRVRGVAGNLFFLSHHFKEEAVDDSSSRSNRQEGDLALRLAKYLVQQGYEAGDVTLLAAYSGQMFYMRKQRDYYAPYLSQVKITVVDNYQGEESKIIILSLVRNNDENKIGFLGTANRICVALSRAREGFYILGNIDILKRNSELWKNIAGTLEANASLGTSMMLKCENHPSQITIVTSPSDFEKVPEGGCLLKCNFNLPCGHQCPRVCHGYDRSHIDTKCFLQCERVLCELDHVCPRKCFEKCLPCKINVEKVLPCGHKMLVPCHKEPADPSIMCLTFVKVTLPDCGHEAKKPCYMAIEQVKCVVRCVYRVDKCGHDCRRKCHVKDDPEHEKYRCEKPCAKAKKGCTKDLVGDRGDHQCPKMCYEDCDYCTVEVIKSRSTCTHRERVACNIDVNETPCRKKCSRVLPCTHFCKKKCHEKCGDCVQMVKKTIPDCQHEVSVICKREATRDLCARACERVLACGHKCTARCGAECDPERCTHLLQIEFHSPCGHKVMLPCNVYCAMKKRSNAVEPELLMRYCNEPCGAELACAHKCGGTCGRCHQGRLHAACTRTCHQSIICGHQCQEPCNQACPPCKVPCEVRCAHSRCSKLCGAPCTPCQEPCPRACPHGRCLRRCGEPCSRPPCDAACPKALRCGHRCRGLCGEPCPNICKTCRPKDFPTDFLGDEFEDHDKFVQLQDCTHVLEVENMDNLMMGDQETVTIRACPMCRKPIVNTQRYKDLVNKMFATAINPIKEKVYGNEAIIKTKREELFLKVVEFNENQENIIGENSHFKEALDKLRRVISQKKVSLLQLEMQFQYLTILDMVGACYRKYKAANGTELRKELLEVIEQICSVLVDKTQKISQQLQMDIGNEIKRLHSIIQLSQILSHAEYKSAKAQSNVETAADEARKVVLSWSIFEEGKAVTALKGFQEAVKVSGIVTREERDLVVKAIGSKAGSWYKCPNGHFYCIADCGGAMETSRCPDCGAAIGGTNHRLLSNNAHAGEVDGSSNAAWSDAYNNMANFNLE